MSRPARYAPAATPSAEDEVFQSALDNVPETALKGFVRHLAELAASRKA